MKTLSSLALVVASVTACAAPSTVATPAPTPAPARAPTVTPARPPSEAPRNWQLLDETIDGVPGISAERAQRELLGGKQPTGPVLVAVIDGGVDTAHVDLRANLWTNPNGLHGWNFIGG